VRGEQPPGRTSMVSLTLATGIRAGSPIDGTLFGESTIESTQP
jgi:hypothetical protein